MIPDTFTLADGAVVPLEVGQVLYNYYDMEVVTIGHLPTHPEPCTNAPRAGRLVDRHDRRDVPRRFPHDHPRNRPTERLAHMRITVSLRADDLLALRQNGGNRLESGEQQFAVRLGEPYLYHRRRTRRDRHPLPCPRRQPPTGDRMMTETNMTTAQQDALEKLCTRYGTTFQPSDFHHPFDLPEGWVAGWAGPIYVGCSPEGHIHS